MWEQARLRTVLPPSTGWSYLEEGEQVGAPLVQAQSFPSGGYPAGLSRERQSHPVGNSWEQAQAWLSLGLLMAGGGDDFSVFIECIGFES